MPKSTPSLFSKPGQRYAVPLKNDPLARFYTSLYKQSNRTSPMAIKWCLEHGLFSKSKAAVYDAQLKIEKLTITKAAKKKK